MSRYGERSVEGRRETLGVVPRTRQVREGPRRSWATVAAVFGVIIGIPLGIVIGRELWILFARGIDAVPDPSIPTISLVLVALGTRMFANLLTMIPARIAARTSTAIVLRSE